MDTLLAIVAVVLIVLVFLFLPTFFYLLGTFLNRINSTVILWQRMNKTIIRRLGGTKWLEE